ncbi:MAG TPA: prolipoprotein diacylglyceryl transferase family protein [Gemmatimonadaceae bacterium]|nr:prolipoprotein diacylglyceryl transferase family protein [Gemmatimonadaceae bacterium]
MSAPIVHQPFNLHLGPLEVTGFGLAVLLAFAIAQVVSARILAERGRDPEITSDCVFAAVVGGLLGAKLYYAVLRGDITELFHRAGFVFWGGLIGGILANYILMRVKHWRFTMISDAAAPGLAAAYSIGRSGCWAVGDDYGRPWSSPFAVAFPDGAPPSTAVNLSQEFHLRLPPGTPPNAVLSVYPTQLFEVTLGFIMFLILWRLRNHKHAEGWLFGVYCVLAGIERFIIEFFRAKDDRFVGPLTVAQLIALAFAVGGALWMAARWNPAKGPLRATPEDAGAPSGTQPAPA